MNPTTRTTPRRRPTTIFTSEPPYGLLSVYRKGFGHGQRQSVSLLKIKGTEYVPAPCATRQTLCDYGVAYEVGTQGLKGSVWIGRQSHRSVMSSRRYPGTPMTRGVFSIRAERAGL